MIESIPFIKNTDSGNFFLLAGPCVVEGEEMLYRTAETIKQITDKLKIPFVFKASYRKANRSRIDSFTGIGDREALELLHRVRTDLQVPVVTDIHSADEAAMAAEYRDHDDRASSLHDDGWLDLQLVFTESPTRKRGDAWRASHARGDEVSGV